MKKKNRIIEEDEWLIWKKKYNIKEKRKIMKKIKVIKLRKQNKTNKGMDMEKRRK
jgi:hypothetical protein